MENIKVIICENYKIGVQVKNVGNGIVVKKINAINADSFMLGFDINSPEKRLFINMIDGGVSIADINEIVFLTRILFHRKSNSFIAKYDNNIPDIGDTIVNTDGELYTLINNQNSIYIFSAQDNKEKIIDIFAKRTDFYLIRKNSDNFDI